MIRKISRILAAIGTFYMMLNSWLLFLTSHIGWPNRLIGSVFYTGMTLLAGIAGWSDNAAICFAYALVFSLPICVTMVALFAGSGKKRFLLPGAIVTVCDALFCGAMLLGVNRNLYSAEDLMASDSVLIPSLVVEIILLLCYTVILFRKRSSHAG